MDGDTVAYFPDGMQRIGDMQLLSTYQKIRDLGGTKCHRWTDRDGQYEDFYTTAGKPVAQLHSKGYLPLMAYFEYVDHAPVPETVAT